ncbi:META domain-containing protein [Parapedobacter koreensis]|uniref:Heat shock protein HslJ n=1 Tax=Parapedobacter koreensis TaxID=332977 RepID=A0A1H7RWA4_9SPHI|nr:META domain-containing protein [Parapedobacter koreensis]SEL63687.1 Heat shock protein HslJ [Parapedobacter koreensis]
MNAYRIFLLVIIACSLFSCEKNGYSDLENTLLDLTNTRWKMEKTIDKKTKDISLYPRQRASYELSFQSEGKLSMQGGCNYHYGNYSTGSNNTIQFSELGPGTYGYCDIHDWEMQTVYGLENALAYRSDGDRLIITGERVVFHLQRIP